MTPQLHLHVLASGSKGNAAVVEGPEGSVLVDCGISRRALLQRAAELGVDMGRVAAVLLTHDHSDHVKGLSVFCAHFDGGLFATAGTVGARKYLTELPFTLVEHSDAFEVAGMRVQAFPTFHDVPDSMGFRFETADDALGYCTDTGHLGPEAMGALTGVRILALESNHDERMLANGPYPSYLKARVAEIKEPTDIMILVSLTCTMCPETVLSAQRIASLNPLVRAEAYDVSHFPELKDQYGAMSVPCIVINRGAVAGAEGEGGEAEQKVEFGKKSIPQMLELVGA